MATGSVQKAVTWIGGQLEGKTSIDKSTLINLTGEASLANDLTPLESDCLREIIKENYSRCYDA